MGIEREYKKMFRGGIYQHLLPAGASDQTKSVETLLSYRSVVLKFLTY